MKNYNLFSYPFTYRVSKYILLAQWLSKAVRGEKYTYLNTPLSGYPERYKITLKEANRIANDMGVKVNCETWDEIIGHFYAIIRRDILSRMGRVGDYILAQFSRKYVDGFYSICGMLEIIYAVMEELYEFSNDMQQYNLKYHTNEDLNTKLGLIFWQKWFIQFEDEEPYGGFYESYADWLEKTSL